MPVIIVYSDFFSNFNTLSHDIHHHKNVDLNSMIYFKAIIVELLQTTAFKLEEEILSII